MTTSPSARSPRTTELPTMSPALSQPFQISGARCHLIGIGGCGMSGLAQMLTARGGIVSGSDRTPSPVTEMLTASGVEVGFDQSGATLPEGLDLVIASAAIGADHPELSAAVNAGVPTMTYAEALGKCMLGRTGIAIAGTHGKSTTVGMLGHTLIQAGIDPTVIVGATCAQLRKPNSDLPTGFHLGADAIPLGPRAGEPGILIGEACEFNRSFHKLHPTIGVINNIEADHLDIYGSLDAVVEAFHEFALRLPGADRGGRLLIAHDNAHRRVVTAGLDCAVSTIGFNPAADYVVSYDAAARRVSLTADLETGKLDLSWTIKQPGDHMAMNSATAAVLALWLGASEAKVESALASFTGVDRRLQLLGDIPVHSSDASAGTVRVYDDYGHHPTEIETTLRALREAELSDREGRLICVFQPHQHSRTRFLMEEFAQSFSHADIVIVPHIYFVRDSEIEKTRVSAADLVDRLRQQDIRAMHLYPFGAIVEQLQQIVRPGDLVVIMGAGPVTSVAHDFVKAQTKTH
ncbi:MAG: UDP-N-acetylmuramate--L-alanine ligase [Phycisphaerales bacterium JB050]